MFFFGFCIAFAWGFFWGSFALFLLISLKFKTFFFRLDLFLLMLFFCDPFDSVMNIDDYFHEGRLFREHMLNRRQTHGQPQNQLKQQKARSYTTFVAANSKGDLLGLGLLYITK
jgi:hypothetical protein